MKKVFALCLVLMTAVSAQALPIYDGFLTTPTGVEATGAWELGFRIDWHVEFVDTAWCYMYSLTDLDGNALDPGAVSHLTVEVSPDVDRSDFWGVNGSPWELGTWGESSFMANSLKLDYGADGQTEWSFYTKRMPVWGDFFAKDGQAGGLGWNTARNAGWDLADPVAPAADGIIDYKILRPDTETQVIPEPGTLGLLGAGLFGLAWRLRRKK